MTTEKFDPADFDLVATDKDKAAAKMNIIMQLRKAADVEGNMTIQFADGKKAKLPLGVIEIALKKFNSFRKPDAKEKLQTAMGKSYKDMIHALKTMREEVELDEATDFRPGDTVYQVGSKLKGTVLHKGNRDLIAVKFGSINQMIPASKLRLAEEVELDEAIDFRKAFTDIQSYAKKSGGIDKTDFEKVAYYVKAIGDNQNTPNVANKAFMAMKNHIAGLDTDVRDGIHVLLKKHGMVKNGRMVQESITEGALGKQWQNGAKMVKSGSITLVKAKNPDADLHTVMKNGKKVGTFVFDDGPDAFSVTNMSTKKVSWADQIDDIPKMFESKAPALKSSDYPKGTSQSAQAFKDKFAKNKKESVELDEGADKAKIQKQIDQAEKYLKTFFGNTSSVKMKKYAIQMKIDKLKKQLEESKQIEEKPGLDAIRALRKEGVEEVQQDLQEAPNYKLYHNTFSGAVQEAIAVAKKQGFEIDEDDWSNKVATGPKKPSKDKTNSYIIDLMKGGKPAKKKLHMQVYNMGPKYELNCYVQ
jgi:hypothetical protein